MSLQFIDVLLEDSNQKLFSGSCESLTCGCCAGMKIDTFSFNQNREAFLRLLFFRGEIQLQHSSSLHEFHIRSQ